MCDRELNALLGTIQIFSWSGYPTQTLEIKQDMIQLVTTQTETSECPGNEEDGVGIAERLHQLRETLARLKRGGGRCGTDGTNGDGDTTTAEENDLIYTPKSNFPSYANYSLIINSNHT
jgi:hypothetical protein